MVKSIKVSLEQLLEENHIEPVEISANDIANFFNIVKRDINDASISAVSADTRFVIAYNAALLLAKIVLSSSGYKINKVYPHLITFNILPELFDSFSEKKAEYFCNCQLKRDTVLYRDAMTISEAETIELLDEVMLFHDDVSEWLKKNHPGLTEKVLNQ